MDRSGPGALGVMRRPGISPELDELKDKLSGNAVTKGLLFSLVPFLLAQILVMPMMGAGLFSANTPAPLMMVMGSLIGHLVYGATLGAVTK